MPWEIAKYIANMLEEMQIVTDEHDLNCIVDALMEDAELRIALENEYGN